MLLNPAPAPAFGKSVQRRAHAHPHAVHLVAGAAFNNVGLVQSSGPRSRRLRGIETIGDALRTPIFGEFASLPIRRFPQEASECQIVFQRRWLDQSTTLVEDVDLRIATSPRPPKTAGAPGTEIRIEKLRMPVSQAEVRRIARSLIKQNVISNCASAL